MQKSFTGILQLLFFIAALAGSLAVANSAVACGCNDSNCASQVAAPFLQPATSHGSSNEQQFLTLPQPEPSELYPATSLRFDPADAVLLCQPQPLASSRIVPRGLVLSYLCDSARHQCSGVQLI